MNRNSGIDGPLILPYESRRRMKCAIHQWFCKPLNVKHMVCWTLYFSFLTTICWIGSAFASGIDWNYLKGPFSIQETICSAAPAYGEVLVFIAITLLLLCKYSSSIFLALVVALISTYFFCIWHTNLEAITILLLGEMILCVAFLKVSMWGKKPFAGLIAAGTGHFLGNMAGWLVAIIIP